MIDKTPVPIEMIAEIIGADSVYFLPDDITKFNALHLEPGQKITVNAQLTFKRGSDD